MSRLARVLIAVGGWSFVVLGVGHLATTLLAPTPAAAGGVIAAMRGFAIAMPGRTGSMYDYYQGFGLMMGILLIAYGVLAVLTPSNRRVVAVHAVVSAVALAMSLRFFFAVPVIAMAVALVAFGAALVVSQRDAREAPPALG
jgi:hypothetical protein